MAYVSHTGIAGGCNWYRCTSRARKKICLA